MPFALAPLPLLRRGEKGREREREYEQILGLERERRKRISVENREKLERERAQKREREREREREERNKESEEERRVRKREIWKDRIEEWLCDAAMRGDVESLNEIVKIDDYILDKVLVGSFKGKNPLLMATSTGQIEFVEKLLNYKQDLAKAVDAELGTALHVASSVGYVEIAKLLVELSPGMCVARDREGNNPLHIAAMKGNVEVLEMLLRVNSQAARAKVDRGDNILHLCVNYDQLESLVLLLNRVGDEEFINSTDSNGNNILHLAVSGKRIAIIIHLLLERRIEGQKFLCFGGELHQLIDVSARNGSGKTAMDIYIQSPEIHQNIKDLLQRSGVRRSGELFFPFDPYWQKKKKDTLIIVSSLMATMSFQVGINPPGGVWQDTLKGVHEAGKSILSYTNPKAYPYLTYFNTIGFLLSLTTILELIVVLPTRKKAFGFIRAGISWLSIMIMAFAYAFSVIAVSPKEMNKSVNLVMMVIVAVWAVLISFFRVLPYQVQVTLLFVIGAPLLFVTCNGLVLLLLPVAWLAEGIRRLFVWQKAKGRIKHNKSTHQSTGDTAPPSNPTEATQINDSAIVSIPID